MTGTDWGDERPPTYAGSGPAPGDQPGGVQQPETLSFGTEAGTIPPRRSRRRLIAGVSSVAAVVVIAIVVVLVTVGSGQTPAQAVAAAVRQSGGYNTMVASLSEKVSGSTAVSITGDVAVRRKPLLMSVKVDENAAGQNIPIKAIISDSAMYLKLGISVGLPANVKGKWIEFKFSQIGASTFGSLLHTLQNENPMSQAEALIAAEHVQASGTQVVGGVQATKYTGSFAPSAAIKLLPKSARSALGPALRLVSGKVHFSLWIGGGRIVQLSEVEHVSTSTVTVTVRYKSYNQPVNITVPSGSQVYALPPSALGGA